MVLMWIVQDKPASRWRPSNLKVVTRWIGPAGVEREGMLVESMRPRVWLLKLFKEVTLWIICIFEQQSVTVLGWMDSLDDEFNNSNVLYQPLQTLLVTFTKNTFKTFLLVFYTSCLSHQYNLITPQIYTRFASMRILAYIKAFENMKPVKRMLSCCE